MITVKQSPVKAPIPPGRVEALTDGVFAIVMTILVLELSIPVVAGNSTHNELTQGLISIWPKILSYVATFLILGFMWNVHHRQFNMIKRSDSVLVWLNILFLMFVALLPFSTSVLGEYLGEQLPILIYGGNFIVCMITRYILWSYATGKYRLVDTDIDPDEVRSQKLMIRVGLISIAVAMGISYLNTFAAICMISVSIIIGIVKSTSYYRVRTS
jgi:uncharacterized membrane protein